MASAKDLRDTLAVPAGDPHLVASFHMYARCTSRTGLRWMPPHYGTRAWFSPSAAAAIQPTSAHWRSQSRAFFEGYNREPRDQPAGRRRIVEQMEIAAAFATRTGCGLPVANSAPASTPTRPRAHAGRTRALERRSVVRLGLLGLQQQLAAYASLGLVGSWIPDMKAACSTRALALILRRAGRPWCRRYRKRCRGRGCAAPCCPAAASARTIGDQAAFRLGRSHSFCTSSRRLARPDAPPGRPARPCRPRPGARRCARPRSTRAAIAGERPQNRSRPAPSAAVPTPSDGAASRRVRRSSRARPAQPPGAVGLCAAARRRRAAASACAAASLGGLPDGQRVCSAW